MINCTPVKHFATGSEREGDGWVFLHYHLQLWDGMVHRAGEKMLQMRQAERLSEMLFIKSFPVQCMQIKKSYCPFSLPDLSRPPHYMTTAT